MDPATRTTVAAMRVIGRQTERDGDLGALLEAAVAPAYRLATVILADPTEAEDAVHDAAVRAWRSRAELRDADRFDAWFERIVVNVCRDRLRARGRRPRVRTLADDDEAARGDEIAAASVRLALDRALAALDPDHAIVVALRYYRDLPVARIAALLGIPEGTVKSRLHHALARLGAALDREDFR